MKKNIFKALFAALLLLCGFFFAITHFGELTRFLLLLRNLDPFWIAAALVFQLATYFSLALVWQRALFFSEVIYPVRKLVPLAIAKLFADQALPSGGISGIAFIVSAFTQHNVSGQVATGVMLLSILSYYGAYVLAAASAILVLWLYHDIHQWIITVSLLFFLISVAIPAGILFLKQWRTIPGWVVRIPHISGILEVYTNASDRIFRNPRLLIEATLFQIAIFILDTATLWAMLHALGEDASLLLAFPCFIIASIVAMLSLIPLGIGAFEVTCAGLLVMLGIRVESAFAATLLLRGFTLWLPMIPGLWLTRRMFL